MTSLFCGSAFPNMFLRQRMHDPESHERSSLSSFSDLLSISVRHL
jgi:hypothetical protein